MSSAANLFIGVEGNPYASVWNLGVFHQVSHCFHNLSDACFVISAEKRVAIGDNKVFANVSQHLGKHARGGNDSLNGVQYDIPTIIVLHDAWVDICTRTIGTCVVVGNETYDRYIRWNVGWQGRIDITLLIHRDIFQSHLLERVCQMTRKNQLFGRTGTPFPLF